MTIHNTPDKPAARTLAAFLRAFGRRARIMQTARGFDVIEMGGTSCAS